MNQELIARYIQSAGIVLVGIALLASAYVNRVNTQDTAQDHTLVVTGKATRKIEPTQSVVTGSWQEKGKTAEEARDKVRDAAGAGVEAIKQAGIEEKKIATTQVTVYPEYDYSPVGKSPAITGYQGTTTVQVTLVDTAKADQIIGLMTEKKATSTSGPSFGLSTEVRDSLQKELKVAAVADAANQAQALAEQAGSKVGEVISITGGDSVASTPPVMPYDRTAIATDVAETSSDITTGEEELSVTVTVTYQLK